MLNSGLEISIVTKRPMRLTTATKRQDRKQNINKNKIDK